MMERLPDLEADETPEAEARALATLRAQWWRVRLEVRQVAAPVEVLLRAAWPAALARGWLVISLPSPGAVRVLTAGGAAERVEWAVRQATDLNVSVVFVARS